MVCWEDLLRLRRNKGLPGHAEMEGKTLFVKVNTGPSGHGSPPAAGQAFALKRAGADGVRVFAFEGEGGLTPGAAHETKNSAYGLGLDNLLYVSTGTTSASTTSPYSQLRARHARATGSRRTAGASWRRRTAATGSR